MAALRRGWGPLITCRVLIDPLLDMVACIATVPSMWPTRATGGYSGLGAESKLPSITLAETYLSLLLPEIVWAPGEVTGPALSDAAERVGVLLGAAVGAEAGAGVDGEAAMGASAAVSGVPLKNARTLSRCDMLA